MPDDVAIEKVQILEKLGARVERVRPGEYRYLLAPLRQLTLQRSTSEYRG
jgi:cysteine synthase